MEMLPAMRHQGYYTPNALAELIDNSIQAGASRIDVLCLDEVDIDTNRRQLKEIAVVDNGKGMNEEELWNAIITGKSTSRGKNGIGRFGVGLTHATLSQCKRVDIYSWQNPNRVLHVHLDINSSEHSSDVSVEEPKKSQIPDRWERVFTRRAKSGTLVVWSDLDQCKWKKANTLIKNSEYTLGRIYRKFLDRGEIEIHMKAFDGATRKIEINEKLMANDPLYLSIPSSTPEPYNKRAMFQKDGHRWEVRIPIPDITGEKHDVITRYSFVRKEVRAGKRNPGSEDYGKHAANNLGVSIIRANRELSLDTNLITSYDPTERWWGAEIEFPPALDEVFGVSTNKQTASDLEYMMRQIGKQSREQQSKKDLEGDEEHVLYQLVRDMANRIGALRDTITTQRKPTERPDPPKPPKPSGPTITEEQKQKMTEEERREAIQELVIKLGIPGKVDLDQDIQFEHLPLSGSQFFDVALVGGVKIITINSKHRAYRDLLAVLLDSKNIGELDNNDAIRLLRKSATGFQKFLAAWASMEDSRINPEERNQLSDIRYELGKYLQEYFKANED